MNISSVSFGGIYHNIPCKDSGQANELMEAITKIPNIEAIRRDGKDVLIIETKKGDENARKIIHLLEDCAEGYDINGRGRAAEAYYKASKYKQNYDAQLPKNINVYK